jgi:hypothetical protein
MILSPEAPELPEAVRAIAERHAAEDRDTLARLLRENKVRRVAVPRSDILGQQARGMAFTRDIERRVSGRTAVNYAIRPKKHKKGRK